jgi:hypothetical protein
MIVMMGSSDGELGRCCAIFEYVREAKDDVGAPTSKDMSLSESQNNVPGT